MYRMILLSCVGSAGVLAAAAAPRADAVPDWVEPMKAVRARFTGRPGTFACFGDSITVSMAFWAPLRGEPKNMPPEMAEAHALVKSYMEPDCWAKWKGPAYGNTGAMTIRWAHENVDKWLKQHNPEVALIMFGTNDLGQLDLKEYEEKTRAVVDRCLANGTIVILSTIPPRSGQLDKARQFADAVRRVARDKRVPLVDYFAEILKRRPDDWDGTLPQFKGTPGDEYQVPTLLARDGVHPSNPRTHQDYSAESLRSNGYALRNYLTLLAYADVIRRVVPADERAAVALHRAVTLYASFDAVVRADRGGGPLTLATRSNHPTEKGKFIFEKGFDAKVFRIAPGKGIHGGALEVTDVLPNNGRVFFPAKGNIAYRKGGWGGAVSLWIKTDPNTLLKTRFCDPVQITQKGAHNGAIWVDFNDAKPRDLRMGVFSAIPEGQAAIKEDDPHAPLIRVPNVGFQAADWHHLVLSWHNFDTGKPDGHAALFIDGKRIGAITDRDLRMDWDLDQTGIYIAVNYIGLLDEFALFDRPLTAAEVRRLQQHPGLLAAREKSPR